MENNEIITLAVFSEDRSDLIPEVPTWIESGLGKEVTNSSDRGFGVKAGTPEDVVAALAKAFETAITDAEQVNKMAELGLEVNFMNSKDAASYVVDQEKVMIDMAETMGWK
jgi:tripartite-type tricarboxylate transporter receptor subunit TctC